MVVDQREKQGLAGRSEPSRTGPLWAEVLTDARGFAALEGEWEGLRAASPSATPFQSWAWLYSWWEHYGEGYELRLLAVREPGSGALVGLAPLMVERGPLPGGRLLFVGTGEANYLDVIARTGFQGRVAGAVAEELRAFLGHGRVADLGDLRSSATAWYLYCVWRGPKSSVLQDLGNPMIDIPEGGWEELLASRDQKLRSNARRVLRRVEADGASWEAVGPEGAEEAARRLVALHRESWQGRDIAAKHLTWKWGSYLVAAAKRMTERGVGAVYELKRGEEVLCSRLLVFDRESVGSLAMGASRQALRRYQISSLLMSNGMNVALDRNVPCFDMMQGEEPYKLQWCTRVVPKRRIILARSAVPWLPYAGYHVLGSRIVRYIKQRVKSEDTPRRVETAAKSMVHRYRVLRRTTRRT